MSIANYHKLEGEAKAAADEILGIEAVIEPEPEPEEKPKKKEKKK